jgi:hypothetical protein
MKITDYLKFWIHRKEAEKFTTTGSGDTAVRIDGDIDANPSGLRNGGKVTEVTINDITWTALPSTALTDRNAMSIINRSGVEVKVNYDNSVAGYVGVPINNNDERYYDIKDTIVIYAKATTGAGSVTLIIEEIS